MKTISPTIQKELVKRLVEEFQPEAIYLFGSYAWGTPGVGSDIDLMVIVQESEQTPSRRSARAHRSLRGLLVPVDILVKTLDEFNRYRSVYASLESQVAEKGKLLYGTERRTGKELAG
jgi:uncharacterized protein